ncbi:MAG TPA: 6,7-dimethyl-8-ribityllumazine synthase [Terriglobales bacterium]|nr:6,7-dimethyl-8-ribityllumazine synthase [Terriglobales bacterium]
MIKSFHKLLVARSQKDYAALANVFAALGLGRGESWKGQRSQGVKFEAREAGVEIGFGRGFPDADLVVECDSADALYDVARKRGLRIAAEIHDEDWGARLFTLELPAGAGRLAVFSYNHPWRENAAGEGKLDAAGKRFAVVVSRFNAFITERLLEGALDGLRRCGAAKPEIVRVPGAFEIPAAARALAESGKFGAIICIGCLLRGDTAHYDVIANECARGIGQSAQDTGVPHAFGVLTCDTLEQAIDRAGLKMGNKGFEAALAAVEMANLVASHRSPVASYRSQSARHSTKRSAKKNPAGKARR